MADELTFEVSELLAELGEPVVDQLLRDGLLRDIPILGSALRVGRLSQTVSDVLLLAKINRFVRGANVTDEERAAFAYDLKRNPDLRQRIGQALILALDRCDDLDKAEILARVFRAFVRRDIELTQFRRLMTLVDRAAVVDLQEFFNRDNTAPSEVWRRLLATGITVTQTHASGAVTSSSEAVSVAIAPKLSADGELLLKCVTGPKTQNSGNKSV